MQKHKLPTLFFIMIVLYNLSSGFVHPVTPTLVVERGLDSPWFGSAMYAVSVGSFLVAPFWGKLCNYIPTKRMTMMGLMGYGLGQFLMMNAYSGPMLMLGRMVAGLLSCAATVSITNYIIAVSDVEHRGIYLTFYATSQSVSNAAGYFVGGFLGIRSILIPFYAQFVILIIASALAGTSMEDDTPYKLKPDHSLNFREVNPFSAFLDARNFMTPLLGVFFASSILLSIGMTSYDTGFTYYIKDHFHLGSQYNGMVKAAVAALSLIVNSLLTSRLIRRSDINLSIFPVIVSSAAMTVAANFFLNDMLPMSVFSVLFSVSTVVLLTLLQNICVQHGNDRTRNSLMGFFQGIRSLGSMIGAFLEARLYAASPNYNFLFAAGILLLAAGLCFAYVRMYKRPRAS
jgi:DHA1 family multidrug resistance protein-like MFS transporter